MLRLLVSLGLPALGILVAALVQVALTTLWPGIHTLPFTVITIDSYVVVLLTMGLCFCAGRWTQRNAPTITGALCTLIVPLAWFGLMVKGLVLGAGSTAWLASLTLFVLLAALAPFLGVVSGWAWSSLVRRQMLRAA